MGQVYFTRHGQTFWNVENKICGATDIGLTELGHKQAEELGQEDFEGGNKNRRNFCTHHLAGQRDTAKHIGKVTGIPMREEIRLKEQNFGKYESTPRHGEEFEEAKKSFINHFDGGESMFEMAQRIYNLLDDLKKESGEKTYLLVAHNGISRVVNSYFHDMTNEEYAAFGIKNCEILKYEF
ncbi:MAG: histidine phosphatase family protein [Eubacterium ventriosum]